MVNPLRPWRRPGRLFRAAAHVAVGLPVAIVTFVVIVVMAALSIGLMPVFLLGVPIGWLTLMMSHVPRPGRAITGRHLRHTDPRRRSDRSPASRGSAGSPNGCGPEHAGGRSRTTCVELPVCAISYAVVAAAWCGSLAMTLLPIYVGTFPGDSAKFYFFEIDASDPARWLAAAVGLVGLVFVAPWITIGAATTQWALADRLLGPTDDERLAAQVTDLQSRRTAAVDSAEAERRRIERDLHDGAQQRLVALAATLGVARDKLDDDPEAGKELVAAAHEEAKAALTEIRDLVRGIHPVILEDRGIDAALSAVVARSPVPVVLDVQVAERPPAAVESAAYFVVTEALTNVARHSGATRAHVSIARAADRLVVEIRDNGHGGADASKGTRPPRTA